MKPSSTPYQRQTHTLLEAKSVRLMSQARMESWKVIVPMSTIFPSKRYLKLLAKEARWQSLIPATSPLLLLSRRQSWHWNPVDWGSCIGILMSVFFVHVVFHRTLSVKPRRSEMWLTHSTLKAEEWLYFHKGQARATVFLGGAIARTFDFTAGDTAVFPDNSGNYFFPSPFPSFPEADSSRQDTTSRTHPKPKSWSGLNFTRVIVWLILA